MPEPIGLYIHIPFCESKCGYCDFYSLPKEKCGKELYKAYVDALLLQMADYKEQLYGIPVNSVFIGGGTPTILSKDLLKKVLVGIKKNFAVSPSAEWTIEANPKSSMKSLFKMARTCGVNRVSLGVQSFNDDELKSLNRPHTAEDAKNAILALNKAKITNFNIDLMYGIPNQDEASFISSIKEALALSPSHISCYALTVEPNTPFNLKKQSLNLADDDLLRKMYFSAVDLLEGAGYKHYEISNFAKPGYECKHNIKYWNCDEYLGLGCAAHSYFSSKRFGFVKDINEYISGINDKSQLVDENGVSEIKANEMVAEYVMLRFRLKDGISENAFYLRFKKDFTQIFGKKLQKYIDSKHIVKDGSRYYFTSEGFFVSNTILTDLIDI